MSLYFISNVYSKWSASPIIITLNALATSIEDIPFPAVTICNMNQARKSVVKNFDNNSIQKSLLDDICPIDQDKEFSPADIHSINMTGAGQWSFFREFLVNASQACSDMLVACRYATRIYNCMEIFETVLSDEGLCCIFNRVDPKFLYQNYKWVVMKEFALS